MEIVFENNNIICINKKAGQPSQPDLTKDISLLEDVEKYLKAEVYILNRIDRPVSGVVLFAKNKKAAKTLSEAISSKQTKKVYYAIVEQKPDKTQGYLEDILIKRGKKAYIDKGGKKGKSSILHYKYIGSGKKYHYLQIDLITGRFHQIRAQLANIGCTIKGDVKYGARRSNKDRSICLHAYEISLPSQYITGAQTIRADFPDSILWDDLLNHL